MEIKFEKGSLNDVDTIVSMQKKLNQMLDLQELNEEAFRKCIATEIQSNDKFYYVAKNNDETIGMISVDFSEPISDDVIDYMASISLIYVDEKYRKGTIAYHLFQYAIDEMQNRGVQSFAMSVEANNPNRFLHFTFADVIIDENKEQTQHGTTTQYLLGVTDINKIKSYSFNEFLRKIVKTKKEFNQVLSSLPRAQSMAYIF